jgi:hypothetical protein
MFTKEQLRQNIANNFQKQQKADANQKAIEILDFLFKETLVDFEMTLDLIMKLPIAGDIGELQTKIAKLQRIQNMLKND